MMPSGKNGAINWDMKSEMNPRRNNITKHLFFDVGFADKVTIMLMEIT